MTLDEIRNAKPLRPLIYTLARWAKSVAAMTGAMMIFYMICKVWEAAL